MYRCLILKKEHNLLQILYPKISNPQNFPMESIP